MKLATVIIIFLLVTSPSISQKFGYGKVSKEELEETTDPNYKEADATVLYREYKTFLEYKQGEGFTLHTEVFERIKLYNPEGFDWATHSVKTYNFGSSREDVAALKGTTYNLEGGSIKKEKLKYSNLFEERISDYYILNTFTMPALKPGCIIEYEYKITSFDFDIGNIDLQYTIPIRNEKIEVRVPEYFIYQNYGNPQSELNFTFEKDSKEKEIHLRGRSGLGTANYGSVYANNPETSEQTVTYKENIFILEESQIPPLKEEAFVDNLANYKAKSVWELAMINAPGELPVSYSTTWEAVTKSIYENDSFVNELNKNDYYQEDLQRAIEGLSDPTDKMAALFNLVKSKVAWNKYIGYFPQNGVKKAYREGEGNSADINLMLVSMLRYAGLDANPVLVSTRRNGIPLFPTRHGFNYIIAAMEYGGSIYLMDATDPFSNINLLPDRAMNWQGRVIRSDGSSQSVGLYPGYKSQKLTYVQAEIKPDMISAVVNERLGDHYAKNYRSTHYGTTDSDQLEQLKTDNYGVSYSEFKSKDIDNTKATMTIGYTANSSSLIEDINGELYFSPMLFFATNSHPFKSETRNYPIFFNYPSSQKYTINLKLPEGYKVGALPEGAIANLANDMGSYTYLIKQLNPNLLQLSVTLDINAPIVLSTDYEFIKSFFGQVVEKEKEKIVLTKI